MIPVIAGAFKKDRQVGNTLAVLIPFVFLIEYMVQFEIGPFFLFLYISFMLGFFAAFPNYFAVNFILGLILPPSISINSIKGVDECIRISDTLDKVEKLIDRALSYLIFYPIKTTISDNEKQWKLSKYYRHHYYLCARANNDNPVDLAFLFFTEGDEKLHQTKRNTYDLKFVKSAIEGCLNSKNIE